MRVRNRNRLLTVSALLASAAAFAHHSVAIFDFQHPVLITGTIKSLLWANPHSQMVLLVPDGHGGTDVWNIAGGSVNSLIRQGLNKKSLAAGMKVMLIIAPRRDGVHNAEFTKVVKVEVNGKLVTPSWGGQ